MLQQIILNLIKVNMRMLKIEEFGTQHQRFYNKRPIGSKVKVHIIRLQFQNLQNVINEAPLVFIQLVYLESELYPPITTTAQQWIIQINFNKLSFLLWQTDRLPLASGGTKPPSTIINTSNIEENLRNNLFSLRQTKQFCLCCLLSHRSPYANKSQWSKDLFHNGQHKNTVRYRLANESVLKRVTILRACQKSSSHKCVKIVCLWPFL